MDEELATVDRLAAIEDIKALKARYFRFLDHKRWDDMGTLFTEDAFVDTGYGEPSTSGAAFVATLVRDVDPARTVHHGHMPEIDVVSATEAHGIWAMFDYVELPTEEERFAFFGYGHYEEEYRKGADGRWRIASMRLTRLRVDPLS